MNANSYSWDRAWDYVSLTDPRISAGSQITLWVVRGGDTYNTIILLDWVAFQETVVELEGFQRHRHLLQNPPVVTLFYHLAINTHHVIFHVLFSKPNQNSGDQGLSSVHFSNPGLSLRSQFLHKTPAYRSQDATRRTRIWLAIICKGLISSLKKW